MSPDIRSRIVVMLLIPAFAARLCAEDRPAVAVDEKAKTADRVVAIRALKETEYSVARPQLIQCLGVRQPLPVQLAALETLGTFDKESVPETILAVWSGMTPTIRKAAAAAVLKRPNWRGAVVNALEKEVIRPADLEAGQLEQLRKSAEEGVRARVEKVLATPGPSKRADVMNTYRKALKMKGDATKGRAVFQETCAACHRIGGVGQNVGPDLAALKDRSAEKMLMGILDPNREVLPQYTSYLLVTEDDRIYTGLIASETADTISIRQTDGTAETVRRTAIQSLRGTGLSAMPEGLEEKIDLSAMANLLAFLDAGR